MVRYDELEITKILKGLAVLAPYPEGESLEIQDSWINFMWCDDVIAGVLASTLGGGHADLRTVSDARKSLVASPEWRDRWPERFDLLMRACTLLLKK